MIIEKCLHCGYCCLKNQCLIGEIYYQGEMFKSGNIEYCPGLFWDDKQKKHLCKLVTDTNINVNNESIRKILFIGCGCSSNMNTWRRNIKKRI